MKKHVVLAQIALAVLIFSSCVTSPRVITHVTGKTWLLSGINDGSTLVALEPGHGSSARLVFASDGTFSGSTGFNTFTGIWSSKSFSIKTITRDVPPNSIAVKFEQLFISRLESAVAIQTEKDSLRFLDGKGRVLIQFMFSPTGQAY